MPGGSQPISEAVSYYSVSDTDMLGLDTSNFDNVSIDLGCGSPTLTGEPFVLAPETPDRNYHTPEKQIMTGDFAGVYEMRHSMQPSQLERVIGTPDRYRVIGDGDASVEGTPGLTTDGDMSERSSPTPKRQKLF